MYMSSSCSDGSYMLQVTFENGTDLDMATVKVQNRVSRAEPTLPSAVRQQGVSVTSRSSDIILFVALETDKPETYDGLYLTNYAQLNIVDELSRIEGVGPAPSAPSPRATPRISSLPSPRRDASLMPTNLPTSQYAPTPTARCSACAI